MKYFFFNQENILNLVVDLKTRDMSGYYLSDEERELIDGVPILSEPSAVYIYTTNSPRDLEFFRILDKLVGLGENILAKWLGLTSRTLNNYRKKESLSLKENLKEHIVILLSLYRQGEEVFGSVELFEKWLSTPNILLDNKPPSDFLETSSGIQFINSRLIAMEYGENG